MTKIGHLHIYEFDRWEFWKTFGWINKWIKNKRKKNKRMHIAKKIDIKKQSDFGHTSSFWITFRKSWILSSNETLK